MGKNEHQITIGHQAGNFHGIKYSMWDIVSHLTTAYRWVDTRGVALRFATCEQSLFYIILFNLHMIIKETSDKLNVILSLHYA